MKLSEKRIESISDKIAFQLVRKRHLITNENLRQVSAWIEHAIVDNLKIEDEINEEVRSFLSRMTTCPPVGSFEYNAIFRNKKEEIAKRRNYEL